MSGIFFLCVCVCVFAMSKNIVDCLRLYRESKDNVPVPILLMEKKEGDKVFSNQEKKKKTTRKNTKVV